MNIAELHRIFLQHRKVSTDTRADLEGTIFFALKGSAFDGNTFVEQAIAKGAVCCVIDNPDYDVAGKTILVDDVLTTLQQLATFHREQYDIPVLAITGSNGKTTTKELVNAVLSTTYKTACTQGNLNNHIGVPLTLLSMPDDVEFAIVEMGANHPQEIDFLCHIAKPNFGLITNIGKAHLEGFGSFEGVVKTKSELYRYLSGGERHCERSEAIRNVETVSGVTSYELQVTGAEARRHCERSEAIQNVENHWIASGYRPRNDGKQGFSHGVFVNHDDALLMDLSKNIPQTTYGTSPNSDVIGRITGMKPFLSLAVELDGREYVINSKLIGAYNAPNILAAACIGNYFHVPAEKIVSALERYQPDNMRSQIETKGSNTIILDAYNANPTSMNAALDNFFMMDFPRKVVILGDMLELGSWSMEEHEKIVNKLKNSNIDEVFLVGKHFKQLQEPSGFGYFDDVDELIRFFENNGIANSLILIKGSRGIGLEKVMNTLKERQ
ncbi:MAG: UDP-N-acetylmuramoyl-tripeptide--D-alanyl-D-alanine ligase [Bacteroidales bacterium]|nr:UDP-N-acetylmuramoyl-tripeptide--D-alanyl-D-alanine ligase [Bacteroidales bacterium]